MVKQMKKGVLLNNRKKQGTLPKKEDKVKCSICFDVIKRRKMATLHDKKGKRVCSHVYCNSCIKEWAKKNNTCPLCRENFFEIISKRERTKVSPPRVEIFDGILDLLMSLMFRRRIRSSFFIHYVAGHRQTRVLWQTVLAPLTRDFIKSYNDRHEISFEENAEHESFYMTALMMGLPSQTTSIAV